MIAIVAGAPILAVAARSLVPVLIGIGIIAVLAIRTAIHCRWKKASLFIRLLHGLHSHIVQIPMLFGLLKYKLDRLDGRTPELIEYKDAPTPVPDSTRR